MLIVGIIFFLVGGGMLLGGLFFLLRKKKFLKTSIGVPGVVTRVDVRRSHLRDDRGFRENWYYPTVRFQTKSGATIEHTMMMGNRYNNNQVGKNVQVNYDEHDPERITLGNPASFTIYIPNLIPMLVGGIFGIIGFGLLVVGLVSGADGGNGWHQTDHPDSKRPTYSHTPRRRY